MTAESTAQSTVVSEKRPEFGARRLLLVVTGAINAVQLPYWLTWLRSSYPDVDTRVLLTRSAEQFIAPQAATALSGNLVVPDRWPTEPTTSAPHVELAEWAEAVAVYPATLHFISRLALGLADTPSALALQCTTAPVCLAPSLPPGVEESPVYARHLKTLAERPNIAVAPTQAGRSLTTGRSDVRGAAPLWTVLALLEMLRNASRK